SFRVALELAQNVGGDLRWRKAHLAELHPRHFAFFDIVGEAKREKLQLLLYLCKAAAHEALDGVDDALRRLNERAPGAVADRDGGPAALFSDRIERNDRRHQVR